MGKPGDYQPTETVASHSSYVTNDRINDILRTIDEAKFQSTKEPRIPFVHAYFSALYTLYDNIFMILTDNADKSAKNLIKDYWNQYKELGMKGKSVTEYDVFPLVETCNELNRLIRLSLQNMEYFFRKHSGSVRSIEQGIHVIQAGGGVFGRVHKVSKEPDEPQP